MRFNNRFCALMDIPDLPIGAFEHIGDRKIKPQGGGGNPISAITDPISKAIGTDGSGGGILGAVEDVGQSIGSGLAEVDKFVGREVPGGWVLPAAIAAAYATGYIDPTLFASEAAAAAGAEAGAGAIATEAGQTAFFNALASGATSAEAVSAGLAADAALGAGALTTDQILSSTGFAPTEGASFVVDPNAVYTAGATQGAPVYDYSTPATVTPGGNVVPASTLPSDMAAIDAQIAAAGKEAAAALPAKISPFQAVQGLKMASGLLSGSQQATPAGATAQFRGSTVPQGAVDYSGILNLLQTRAQKRNPYSLLG